MFSQDIKTYKKLFSDFKKKTVLIVGDVMVDSYFWGKVERISPEAPVPVVKIEKTEHRLGGAANVAVNISELGGNSILCSIIGKDKSGNTFLDILKSFQMSSEGILQSSNRPTTCKTRVIGNNAQLIRIDDEEDKQIAIEDQKKLVLRISEILSNQKIDVVVFEDYDKGVISEELIHTISIQAQQTNIPIIVDPKKRNFYHYKNVNLFKPNFKELREGLKLDLDINDKKTLLKVVSQFQKQQCIDILLVTLSEHGVLVSFTKQGKLEQTVIPAHFRNIADVSGAGDTLTATAALCVACNLPPDETAAISNLAGGLVCEKVGVVPIMKEQLLNEILLHL